MAGKIIIDPILGKPRSQDPDLETLRQQIAAKAAIAHIHTTSQITGLDTALAGKQETLVSGTNIKTVNGQSVLGQGNINLPQNVMVGTQAERLAYTPFEGLEWHETGGSDVKRYLYENSSWQLIEEPETASNETVVLHVSTFDGQGTVTGLNVGITNNNTHVAQTFTLNSNGECTFSIPKGNTYTVSVQSLTGYHDLPEQTFEAVLDNRGITMVFLAISAQYETVVFSVCAYNNTFVPSTALQNEFVGTTVNLQITGGSTMSAVIGSDYKATFQVPYGSEYTINAPAQTGFMAMYQKTWTKTASIPERAIPSHYIEWSGSDIMAIDTSTGNRYSYEAVEAMSAAEKSALASHVALFMNNSTLQAANASFAFKLPVSSAQRAWANSNVAFNPELLPYKTSHAVAVLDLNGPTNTQYIKDIGDSLSIGTPAADWCTEQTLTIDGTTYYGYLGAYGEQKLLADCAAQIIAWEILLGLSQTNFASGGWWSSTQFSAASAVNVYNGSFYGTYKTNDSSSCVALFRPYA